MYRTFFKSIGFLAVVVLAGFFTSCQQEDGITSVDNFVLQSTMDIDYRSGAGRAGCYELVFPVTLQFADSSTAIVNSYDEMKQAMRDWFEANGGGAGNGGGHGGPHGHGGPGGLGRPFIVLPFQVINEAGEIITIETPEQLAEIRALCNPGGGDMDTTGHGGGNDTIGHGHHGHGGPGGGGPGSGPCFTLNYPLSVMFADSSVVLVNSKEELQAAVIAWHEANPGQHVRPEFVFPLSVTLADGTVVTVNSRDEIRALKEACRG
jgi:hypothetical protein